MLPVFFMTSKSNNSKILISFKKKFHYNIQLQKFGSTDFCSKPQHKTLNFSPHKPTINRFFQGEIKMDGLSAEVSEKIRAAIRAKLVRICRYISNCILECVIHFILNVITLL